ncbi:hypothetical protein Tco_0945350, partial [Tanacetum coccineum]
MAKGEPKRKKAKKDVFTVNLYYDGLFTSCPMIYFQGQCKVLTDTNFDEITYVHLLEILKRLAPNGFKNVYYCKSGAKLSSIREIKSDQDIVDMLKDRNEELRNTRIKAELDSSDDDLEEIENVDFHTEGDDSVVIKNLATQDPFLTKLCSARILFRGNVEYGVNEETPQVDPDDNQIDLKFMGQCASRGGGRSGRGNGNDGSGSGSGVIGGTGSGSAVNDGTGSGSSGR